MKKERILIEGDRYLLYYTFDDEETEDSHKARKPEPVPEARPETND